jgi:DNA-binding CsgD family transcriptional regulator
MTEEDGWTEELPWVGQYILDENGNAMPAKGLLSWGRWIQGHQAECRLARDEIGNVVVSTVFMGLDTKAPFARMYPENFDPITYRPVLWETMIFGGSHDLHERRYTSKEDALAGHRDIVQMLKQEHAKLSNRTKAGMEKARRNGTGSGKPFGRPRLTITPDEAKRLREGPTPLSYKQIADRLGVSKSSAKRLCASIKTIT